MEWAKNIAKSDPLYEELGHYAIEQFMINKRYSEVIDNETKEPGKHAKGFIIMIMKNSWYGAKSEFSRYHKAHRADIGTRKRNVSDIKFDKLTNIEIENYDEDKDFVIEAIQGILEEMAIDTKRLWYNAKLFQMYLENQNYSAISRDTNIPRTSIAAAVEEAKEYIKQQLKLRNIDYEF